MNFSKRTLNIFKNWSNISPGLILRPGHDQMVISHSGIGFAAKATLDEDIPVLCAIFGLSQFVNVLNLFSEPPNVMIDDKATYLSLGNTSAKYMDSSPILIQKDFETRGPENLQLKSVDLSFTLSQQDLSQLRHAAGIMDLDRIVIQGDGSTLQIVATNGAKMESSDGQNSSNHYVHRVEQVATYTPTSPFAIAFQKDDFGKFLNDGYTVNVEIGKKRRAQFIADDSKVSYFVAAQAVNDLVPVSD